MSPHNVMTCGLSLILVRPDTANHDHVLNAELSRLTNVHIKMVIILNVTYVVIAGLPNVSRAVIAVDA